VCRPLQEIPFSHQGRLRVTQHAATPGLAASRCDGDTLVHVEEGTLSSRAGSTFPLRSDLAPKPSIRRRLLAGRSVSGRAGPQPVSAWLEISPQHARPEPGSPLGWRWARQGNPLRPLHVRQRHVRSDLSASDQTAVDVEALAHVAHVFNNFLRRAAGQHVLAIQVTAQADSPTNCGI
jgi:hypothetical protein